MKMPQPLSALVLSCSISVGGWVVGSQTATAQAPPYLPLQGYLTDTDGVAIDGDVGIRFRLYAAATGGDVLWEETQPDVNVDQGQMTVYLGDVEPLDLGLFAERALFWVGIKVGDDPESTPRVQLGTAAFSAYAEYAGQCGNADTLGGREAGDYVSATDEIPWSSLAGVPADLADGDDDTHDWASITGKPSGFTPTGHTLTSHTGDLPASRLSGTLDPARLNITTVTNSAGTAHGRPGIYATCPSGSTRLGGGCTGGSYYNVAWNAPDEENARRWYCVFDRQADAPTGGTPVTAWAICLN